MSKHVIQCWNCGTRLNLDERNENDGDCMECGVELALDDYLVQAANENAKLRSELAALKAGQGEAVVYVSGIGRDADHPRAVVLYLRTEPSDDDMRAIQNALRSSASAPSQGGEAVEVVAYITRPSRMTMDGWEDGEEYAVIASEASDADKCYGVPLMTVAQHNRIMASAPPATADAMLVPRELARRLTSSDNHVRQTARRELRVLIYSQGVKP